MIALLLLAALILTPGGFAQAMPLADEAPAVAAMNPPTGARLEQRIAPLRLKLAAIQAALEKSGHGRTSRIVSPPVRMTAADAATTSAAAKSPAMTGNPMPAAAGCCGGMMGKMSAAGSPATPMQSDLPGFPGISHLYHVGATGFFLDYSTALELSTDQTVALNRIKENSRADAAAVQRHIDQAEQELWLITGSDQPDYRLLNGKVRNIEKLRGDQRIAFIRTVGEAARVLTGKQRIALLGTGAPVVTSIPALEGSAGPAVPRASAGSPNPTPGMPSMVDDPMDKDGGKGAIPGAIDATGQK